MRRGVRHNAMEMQEHSEKRKKFSGQRVRLVNITLSLYDELHGSESSILGRMMQTYFYRVGTETRECILPSESTPLFEHVLWGSPAELFTPAYWKLQMVERIANGIVYKTRLGQTLLEEVAACMLGGYGIPAELGLAAFNRLRNESLLDGFATETEIREALVRPFLIGNSTRKYRFAYQKSSRLESTLALLKNAELPSDDKEARDYLCDLPGVGPKTASWIIRNDRQSDSVAILDIHIIRAGSQMNLFKSNKLTSQNYRTYEEKFLHFANEIGESAGQLDALMWDQMRKYYFASVRSRRNLLTDQSQLEFVY